MDNKLIFTGGEPNMREDDFLRIQKANREFIQYFLKDFGECIIAGESLAAPGAGNDLILTEDAYIFLDGEVLKVDADTYSAIEAQEYWRYEKVTTDETGGDKTFLDGNPRQTWQKNRGVPVSVVSISGGDLDVIDGFRWRQYITKTIDIGVWNMDATNGVTIPHGLSDHTKIRNVSAVIISDAGAYLNFRFVNPGTGTSQGEVNSWDATNLTLTRLTGGTFDSTSYDDGVINRGFVTIKYEV